MTSPAQTLTKRGSVSFKLFAKTPPSAVHVRTTNMFLLQKTPINRVVSCEAFPFHCSLLVVESAADSRFIKTAPAVSAVLLFSRVCFQVPQLHGRPWPAAGAARTDQALADILTVSDTELVLNSIVTCSLFVLNLYCRSFCTVYLALVLYYFL